ASCPMAGIAHRPRITAVVHDSPARKCCIDTMFPPRFIVRCPVFTEVHCPPAALLSRNGHRGLRACLGISSATTRRPCKKGWTETVQPLIGTESRSGKGSAQACAGRGELVAQGLGLGQPVALLRDDLLGRLLDELRVGEL